MGKTLATKFSKPQASFIFSFSELEQIAVTKRLLCPLFIVVIFFFFYSALPYTFSTVFVSA